MSGAAVSSATADTQSAKRTINLSLVSHTNAGKTTLARTLLMRDIGEVRDAAHVTEIAEAYPLVESAEGDRLLLWDTPGFGDSVRLARRLEQSGNPFGWLLSQVWDRLRDRPLWSSRQAIDNVREHADLVLYLVNASEDPVGAGYIEPELRILDWIGKPVVVLLNQVGAPRAAHQEATEIERWQTRLSAARTVRRVLVFDAFARCWVQETVLLRAVADALPVELRPGAARLVHAWHARGIVRFDQAMRILAERVARAAADAEPLQSGGLRGTLREAGAALGIGGDRRHSERRNAMRRLAERLDADIRSSTDRLIALHGLQGRSSAEVIERLAEHYAVDPHLSEGKAAILGGILTGSLAGLKADLATGGFTLGGGLIAGGILGALGAAGLAKGYNLVRGGGVPAIRFADPVLDTLVESALIAYLTVAHFGRGRGDWKEGEKPAHWGDTVKAVLERRRAALHAIWAQRGKTDPLEPVFEQLRAAARDVLDALYPGALGSTGSAPTAR